jgi:hypothetical protein
MIGGIRGMLFVRWAAARLMLAIVEDRDAALALALQRWAAAENRGDDLRDEMRLIWGQFGHRTPFYLRQEADRLVGMLAHVCARCDRRLPGLHFDKDQLCFRCVVAEGRTDG